jgi:hypothetical protein
MGKVRHALGVKVAYGVLDRIGGEGVAKMRRDFNN